MNSKCCTKCGTRLNSYNKGPTCHRCSYDKLGITKRPSFMVGSMPAGEFLDDIDGCGGYFTYSSTRADK